MADRCSKHDGPCDLVITGPVDSTLTGGLTAGSFLTVDGVLYIVTGYDILENSARELHCRRVYDEIVEQEKR